MILVVVGRVADAVDIVLLVLMSGGAVTDFASCGCCCAVRGDSVVGTANGGDGVLGGAAKILYFMLN